MRPCSLCARSYDIASCIAHKRSSVVVVAQACGKKIHYSLERRYEIGILTVPNSIEFDSVHAAAVDCKVAANL